MRLPDWKARLTAYVAEASRRPYEMGAHDCALFAAGAIKAVTGADPATPWRGKYVTKSGGLRLVRRAGFADHVVAATRDLEEIAPVFAAAGDIASVESDGALVLAVVQGEVLYVLRPDGLGLIPRSMMQKAWRT